MPRTDPDANYVLNLCDALLARPSFRQYRFPFLFNKGKALPVDAYYPDLNLVVEYRGVGNPYDRGEHDTLLQHGVSLVEVGYADLPRDPGGRLRRLPEPIRAVLQGRLAPFVPAEPSALLRHRGVDPRPGTRL